MRRVAGRRLVVIALPLALVIAGLEVWHAARRIASSRIAARVEQRSLVLARRGAVPPAALSQHLKLLRRAAALDPTNVTIPLMRGSQYLLLHNPQAALRAYNQGLALEPRAEIYLNIGRAQRMAGDDDAAAVAFRHAVDLDPSLNRDLRVFFERRRRAGAKRPDSP